MRYTISKRLLTAATAVLVFSGCEQSAPLGAYPGVGSPVSSDLPVMIDTDAQSYAMGARVAFRLVNRTGRTVRYNLCRSSLERLSTEGDWRQARETLADTCTADLRTLAPGQIAEFAFNADTRRPPGEYRVRTTLEGIGDGARLDVVSNRFMLTRDGS